MLTAYQLAALLAAATLGGTLFGMTGFAYGVVTSLFLHHVFPPADVVLIVVSGGTVLNLLALPRFAREVRLRLAGPFLLGAALGLPLGLYVLASMPIRAVRLAVGVLIIVYCALALRQRHQASVQLSPAAAPKVDALVGFVGGVVGGVSGLGPLIPGVWYGLRGFTKLQQRGLALAYGLFMQGGMTLWMLRGGSASAAAYTGVALAVPLLVLASWLGMRAFNRFSAQTFQLAVVCICLVGGVVLVGRQLAE
ncbi:MAG: TSUP family transporter [Lautropia sp.]